MRFYIRSIAVALAAVALASRAGADSGGTSPPAHAPGMPNVIRVSGCIPAMGYHYADPKTLPFGPIYGWYGGRWVFTEIMPSVQQLKQHPSWDDQLRPLPGYKIDHVDFWFNPNGHEGYWIPHYDIHAFYVPHKDHMFWCGNTTGRRPYFYKGPHGEMEWRPIPQ